jgi:hypothetical protein
VARPDLRVFVEKSLDALEREASQSYLRLCETLDRRRVCIAGDGERFVLRFNDRAVTSAQVDGTEDVFIGLSRDTILELVDGSLRLEDALRLDLLDVRASVGDAAAAFDGLLVYLRGAIRCPSMPRLLSQFRGASRGDFR